jgi:hypothetical protein
MAIKDEESRMLETQKPYEAPRAVRLSDSRGGAGSGTETCRGPGSGAGGDCVSGFAAGIMCYQTGSSAEKCDSAGSGASELPPG